MSLNPLLLVKNISAKEAAVLLPIMFNRLVSVRQHMESIIGDIRELENAMRDLLDPDGEVTTAPFQYPEQNNIPVVVNTTNISGDGTVNTRNDSDG